jgi:integrase/recombinase XerC
MLHNYIEQFLHYCQATNFTAKSLEALTTRLNEFNRYCQKLSTDSISSLTYSDLLNFVADFEAPSVHKKKSRVWVLRQFYRFLKLNQVVSVNLAIDVPYPKMEKKVPHYLTIAEFNQILDYFALGAQSAVGLRNLIIVMLFGFLGLRLQAVLRLNVEDVDLVSCIIHIQEKGGAKRNMALPKILCEAFSEYLKIHEQPNGPLFLSKRKKRISEHTIQDLLGQAMQELSIEKHLHAHLFRHTAATHLNKVAGPDITQQVLGHALRRYTEQYSHLNPDIYVSYMKKHPYMNV